MLGGIADALAEHNYNLLLAHAPVEDVLKLRESRVMRQSDGTIFIGQGEQHDELNAVVTGPRKSRGYSNGQLSDSEWEIDVLPLNYTRKSGS